VTTYAGSVDNVNRSGGGTALIEAARRAIRDRTGRERQAVPGPCPPGGSRRHLV